MKQVLILAFLSALTLQGCLSGKTIPARHYILEFPADYFREIEEYSGTTGKTCILQPINVYPAFSTNQIAIRENTHEIAYFSFNQWAVRPQQSLSIMLNDFLEITGLFSEVIAPSFMENADYILETNVFHLEVVAERNLYHARLNLEYLLRDFETQKTVLRHRADRKTLLDQRDLNLFAEAISEMFLEETAIFSSLILENEK